MDPSQQAEKMEETECPVRVKIECENPAEDTSMPNTSSTRHRMESIQRSALFAAVQKEKEIINRAGIGSLPNHECYRCHKKFKTRKSLRQHEKEHLKNLVHSPVAEVAKKYIDEMVIKITEQEILLKEQERKIEEQQKEINSKDELLKKAFGCIDQFKHLAGVAAVTSMMAESSKTLLKLKDEYEDRQ